MTKSKDGGYICQNPMSSVAEIAVYAALRGLANWELDSFY